MEDLTGKIQLIQQVEPQKVHKTSQRQDDKEAMQVNHIWKAAQVYWTAKCKELNHMVKKDCNEGK